MIEITHHNWRTDEQAVIEPWGVRVDGEIVTRQQSIGDAGRIAVGIAGTDESSIRWDIVEI